MGVSGLKGPQQQEVGKNTRRTQQGPQAGWAGPSGIRGWLRRCECLTEGGDSMLLHQAACQWFRGWGLAILQYMRMK